MQRFLQRFIDPTSSEDENAGLDLNEPLYMQKLEEVRRPLVSLFVRTEPNGTTAEELRAGEIPENGSDLMFFLWFPPRSASSAIPC